MMADDQTDDDFGDFSAAESKPTENGSHPQVEHSEDPFGDFASHENDQQHNSNEKQHGEKDVTLVGQPAEQIANANDDSFGDFGSAPASEDPQPETEHQATGEITAGDEDDFGDFGGATDADENVGSELLASAGNNPSETETNARDSNGLLDAVESIANQQESTDKADSQVENGKSDDDNSKDWEPLSETQEASDEHGGDDFGVFGGAPAPAPASQSLNGVDDFGDFGSASITDDQADKVHETDDKAAPAAQSLTGNDDFGSASLTDDQADKGHEADNKAALEAPVDDFGDFGSAAHPGEPTVNEDDFRDFGAGPSPENAATGDDKPEVSSVGHDEDDFGDFGSATDAAHKPIASEVPANGTADVSEDGFGEFGSATNNTDVPAVASPSNYGSTEDSEDFGDFDAAPEATNTSDDDDFGDFGSAEASSTVPAPVSPAPNQEDNGDSEGFGDFSSFNDEAQAQPVASSKAGFSAGSSLSKTPTAKAESDSVLQNARRVFSKVFQRYALEKAESGDNDTIDHAPIESLMASLDKETHKGEKESSKETLLSIMKESKKKTAPPAFVVAEDEGSGTNAHFSVPINRVEVFDEGGSYVTQGQAPASTLPDMLPIELSPAESARKSATDDQAAPHSEPSPRQEQGQQATIVQLPPEQNAIDSKEQQQPEKVRSFLQQVPDLSFMLRSELSLPSTRK